MWYLPLPHGCRPKCKNRIASLHATVSEVDPNFRGRMNIQRLQNLEEVQKIFTVVRLGDSDEH